MAVADLARALLLAIDPVAFSRAAGIDPDPWQARVLRDRSDRLLLNCSRQSGKSETTATLVAWTACYQPESLCLMLSPSLRQSGELFRKAAHTYRAAGRPVATVAESALTVSFSNGSRIVSLPSDDRIRGFSAVRLLAVDEASRVDDATYATIRPMLAVSSGKLIAMSTPNGKRGWWHNEWVSDRRWSRYEIPASECPRIDPAFLEEERETLGRLFDQEYGCAFLESEGNPFTWDDVEAAFSDRAVAWEIPA